LTSIFSLVFIARTVHNLFYTLNITQSYFPTDMLNPVQWEALVSTSP
jgi:hypothetical protein